MSESLERWGDAAPAWMREAASAYGGEGPSQLELDRMLARVQPAPLEPSPDTVVRTKVRLRLGGALVLGALAVTLLALVLSRAPSVPRRTESPQVRAAAPPAPVELAAPPPRTVVANSAAGDGAREPRSAPPMLGKAKPNLHRSGELTADPLDELTLLVRARRVLARDPARAYALTERHRTSYRRGALSEERELLAIEALVVLGHRDAAEARAAQFTQRFPRSVHARKLAMILRGTAP